MSHSRIRHHGPAPASRPSRRDNQLARSRRSFLRGLGSVALTAPLLQTLLTRVVHASEGACPVRFFLMFTGNGQHPSHWIPGGGETDFTLSPVLEPLEPLREKLLLLRGFHGGFSHSQGMSGSTTGRPAEVGGTGVATGGPSIDQFFADKWHGSTPLHSLEVGVLPANAPHDQTVYADANAPIPIPPIGSPSGAFSKVLHLANQDPAILQASNLRQKKVLDVFAKDITALQSKLGPSSRVLLDQHLTLLEEQIIDLQQPVAPLTCDLPSTPTDASMVGTWTAHNATIAAAFRCGVTRVASLRAGGWGGIESGGYHEIGISGGHHNIAHGGSGDPYNNLLNINRFHCEKFGELAALLDSAPEGDGTVLDNTVLVWVNELGLGEFNHHSRTDTHVVLLGGKNTGMAQERYRVIPGTHYHHFLFTLTQLLGHSEETSFGIDGSELVTELFA